MQKSDIELAPFFSEPTGVPEGYTAATVMSILVPAFIPIEDEPVKVKPIRVAIPSHATLPERLPVLEYGYRRRRNWWDVEALRRLPQDSRVWDGKEWLTVEAFISAHHVAFPS